MNTSFTTKADDVLSAFQSISPSHSKDINATASSLLFSLACDNTGRSAVLPATVGWFALTLDTELPDLNGAKLQILGTNADGYLVFAALASGDSAQLCVLRRGENVHFNYDNGASTAALRYEQNAVELSVIVNGCQHYLKTLVTFIGSVPKSKVGKGDPVARPLDDAGAGRVYLDHSLVNIQGERVPVSFARTEHKRRVTYQKHAHIDDNIRFICSGVYRFTIFDPDTDEVVQKCEAISGDSIQVPAGYAYIEEVIEPGVVINSRSTRLLHYRINTPAELRKSTDVTLARGILNQSDL